MAVALLMPLTVAVVGSSTHAHPILSLTTTRLPDGTATPNGASSFDGSAIPKALTKITPTKNPIKSVFVVELNFVTFLIFPDLSNMLFSKHSTLS